MGQWTKDGYVPGKEESARQEKNHWRKRANIAENAMKSIRRILQTEPEPSDAEIVDYVCTVLDDWEARTSETSPPVDLHQHIITEIGRALDELAVPMNTGLIAESILRQLRSVVQRWPNVTVHNAS